MLYSIGKDSSVLRRAGACKAFHPAKPPFPLLHIDTTWKFRDMYALRDWLAAEFGLELIVHMNPDGLARGHQPVRPRLRGAHDVMKTEALRQALDAHGFDLAFGGARRDEERSRAKERVFSFRTAQHTWDPKRQRPELWRLYNGRTRPGREPCASSRCRTGPSSTSGSTSSSRASPSSRSTSPPSGRSSSATAP